MTTHEGVLEKVRSTLVEALGVDAEAVTPAATLRGDLGAESIDLLDIVFRLERNFGIKIPRGELFPEAAAHPDPTPAAAPMTNGPAEPSADLEVEKILDRYTVDMLVQYVAGKLQAA